MTSSKCKCHVSGKKRRRSPDPSRRGLTCCKKISAPPDAQSARLFARSRPFSSSHARCGCAIRSRAARCDAGANLADVNGQCFLDLDNNFAILIHWDGFAPALDAVTRIVRDGSRLFNPTAHEIDLAELPAQLSSGGRADPFRQTSTLRL